MTNHLKKSNSDCGGKNAYFACSEDWTERPANTWVALVSALCAHAGPVWHETEPRFISRNRLKEFKEASAFVSSFASSFADATEDKKATEDRKTTADKTADMAGDETVDGG